MPSPEPGANGLPTLVTSKYGKKNSVRRPASYEDNDTTFDLEQVKYFVAERSGAAPHRIEVI